MNALNVILEPSASPSRGSAPRRGLTLVLVMGLLAMTLAVSYAMLRWQATSSQTRMNAKRGGSARQAAHMGLSLALRKMSTTSWAGADTSFTGQLSSAERYQVSYATGDPRLTDSSADAAKWPYRVTVTSVGFAADPSDVTNVAQYTLRAIVQIIPRSFVAQPGNWSSLNRGTVHQWANENVVIQPPCRIEGLCSLQGGIKLADSYPSSGAPRDRYIADLQAWRLAGGPDYRPFTGTVEFPYWRTASADRALISTSLGVPTTDVATTSGNSPLAHPGGVSTYQLYTGGKSYATTSLPSQISNVSYRPHPRTNPLGICHRAGELEIDDNVTIEGLVVVSNSSDLNITGENVQLTPTVLPLLASETEARRLPTLLVSDDLYVASGAGATVQGMVWSWDKFEVQSGLMSSAFDLQGRLVTNTLELNGRYFWNWPFIIWSNDHSSFLAQEISPGGNRYFPSYMHSLRGLNPKPLLTLRPDSSVVTYHWHDWSQPLIVAASGDQGLRWDLIDWAENP